MLPKLREPRVPRLAGGVAGSALDSLSWQLDRPEGGEHLRGLVAATLDILAPTVGAAQALLLKPVPERADKRAHQRKAFLSDERFEGVDTAEFVWYINRAGDRYPHQ